MSELDSIKLSSKVLAEKLSKEDGRPWVGHHGEFELHTAFQPIFKLIGGVMRPVAFEALLRPYVNGVPAVTSAFFAELDNDENALIDALSRMVHLRNATQIHPDARKLFLNIDPSNFTSEHSIDAMLNELGAELREANFSPTDCICEVMERSADKKLLSHFVYGLRSRGYIIAIDDFGAEASDMQRVMDLTPDIVKVDGALVRRLMETPEGTNQLRAIIDKFKELRIASILEGIEELWQIDMAHNVGADMLQGFALAVPRTLPEDFAEWFVDRKPLKQSPIVSRPATNSAVN